MQSKFNVEGTNNDDHIDEDKNLPVHLQDQKAGATVGGTNSSQGEGLIDEDDDLSVP